MSFGTLLRLLFASLVVGLVLAWLDVEPGSLLARARAAFLQAIELVRGLLGSLIDSGGDLVGYVLMGAVIVIPVWLLSLLWRAFRRRS